MFIYLHLTNFSPRRILLEFFTELDNLPILTHPSHFNLVLNKFFAHAIGIVADIEKLGEFYLRQVKLADGFDVYAALGIVSKPYDFDYVYLGLR